MEDKKAVVLVTGGHGSKAVEGIIRGKPNTQFTVYTTVGDSGGSTGRILDWVIAMIAADISTQEMKKIIPMGDYRSIIVNFLDNSKYKRVAKLMNERSTDAETVFKGLKRLQRGFAIGLEGDNLQRIFNYIRLGLCGGDLTVGIPSLAMQEGSKGHSIGNLFIAALMAAGEMETFNFMLRHFGILPRNLEVRFINPEALWQKAIDIQGGIHDGEHEIDEAGEPIAPLQLKLHRGKNGEIFKSSDVGPEVLKTILSSNKIIIPPGSVANTFNFILLLSRHLYDLKQGNHSDFPNEKRDIKIVRIANFAVGPNEFNPVLELYNLVHAGITNVQYILPFIPTDESDGFSTDVIERYNKQKKEIVHWPKERDQLIVKIKESLLKAHEIGNGNITDQEAESFARFVVDQNMVLVANVVDIHEGKIRHNSELVRDVEAELPTLNLESINREYEEGLGKIEIAEVVELLGVID